MAITGVTEEEYKHFLAHGGTLVFEIGATDIDPTGGFENSGLVRPYLESGFELKPSPILDAPDNSAALFLYGGSWTRVIAHTYKNGGSIVYRKLPNGRYEARIVAPAR
jgi:hypothetical protein